MRAITAYDIVNNRISSEEINESRLALGLNKQAKKIHNETNEIDNISDYYVDLGLPSGNLLAKCNVGAASEEDAGDYYTHKKAYKEFQEQIPDYADWEELLNHCTIGFNSISNDGEKGLVAKSKADPNKEVFFPAGGYIDDDGELYGPFIGKYLYGDYEYHVMAFNAGYNSMDECSKISTSGKQKFSLRLISRKSKDNKDKKITKKVNESTPTSLGLNKQAKQKHSEVDSIDNVSEIRFEDPEVEHICHEHGVYTIEDAAKVTSLGHEKDKYIIKSWFNGTPIKTFNEFKYFTGLRELSALAFYQCEALESITLPYSITKIRTQAFDYCIALKNISISNSVTSIEDYVFSYCRSLQSINIPDSVTNIGLRIFWECNSLKTIYISKGHPLLRALRKRNDSKHCKFVDPNEVNESISSLGLNKKAKEKHDKTNPIDNFDEFVDLGLPSGIRWAKYNVGATSEEEYGDYYSYKDIESFAKGNIRVPDNTDWTELKRYCAITFETLGDGSRGMKFTSKSDPSKYILLPPAGFDNYGNEYRGSEGHYMLRNIYGYVFNFVGGTGSATFKKIQIFDDSKFSVRLIEYPEKKKKAKKIEESSHLGLNKQAKKKFSDADAVDNVAYIKFEDPEVERICHEHGVYTIEDAASVTTIIDETQWHKPSWFYGHKIKTFNEFKYFTGLKKVERHAFNFNTTLETITLPSSIETIGFGAFKGCRNLVKVTMQEGLKTIETYAFDNCRRLKRLVFPEGLEKIESLVIEGCFDIKSVNVPDSVNYLAPTAFNECRESLNTIYISSNHHLRPALSKAYPRVVLVDPKEVNENLNLGLNSKAKEKHDKTNAIDLVANITFEDPEVERVCHEHDVYTYGDAIKVSSIEGWFSLVNIKSFVEFKYFTGLKEIENNVFEGCSFLQSINIPDSVSTIGNEVFYECRSLRSINIPDSVKSIEENAFYHCVSLQSINIPDSVTSIRENAFIWCENLQSINIPDSVTYIGKFAFFGTPSLHTIYISRNCPVYSQIRKAYPGIQLIKPKVNESSNLGLNKYAKKQHSSENIETTSEELVYSLDNPEDTKKSIAYKIIDLIPENWYIYSWIDEFIQIVSPAFDGEADTCPLGIITFSYEDLPLVNINFEGLDFTIKLTYDKIKNAEILEDCISKISTLIENLKTRKRHRNFGWWRKNDSEGKELRQMNKMNKNKVKMLIMNNEKRMD